MTAHTENVDVRAMQVAHAQANQRLPTLGRRVMDGFKNFVTKLGVVGADKTTATQVAQAGLLTFPELNALYLGDGLGKRIVDLAANDATRAGFDFDGDPGGVLVKKMRELRVSEEFNQALKWKRLFGGAITVCLWDDGMPLWTPFRFNPKKPQKLRGLRTHSASEIWLMPTDIDYDETSLRYEKPERFTVRRVNGPPFVVHFTRCIEWLGNPVPDKTFPGLDIYRRYWGTGVIQACFQDLADYGISWTAISNLMQESVVGKYTLANMDDLLAENDYGMIEQRMMNIEMSKSVIKGVMLGKDDAYERDSLTFTGVADVMDRMQQRVSAVADPGYPVSILFGRGAAGMNATGEGDARQYYDGIEALQDRDLRNPVNLVAHWLAPSELPKVKPDEIQVKFKPVWSLSEKDLVEAHYKQSQADALYLAQGALSPLEVRKNRFEGGYSFNTSMTKEEAAILPVLPGGIQETTSGRLELGTGAAGGARPGHVVKGSETGGTAARVEDPKQQGEAVVHAPSAANRTGLDK